ncbi:MAG: NAD(P)H-hydrate dehydratase [Thermomicrobiales bacterium]|nr:NAD(P)H-hydrate dehydratase [Thermomicrobiales bacterium]
MARGVKQENDVIEISEAWAASILPRRDATAHKWSVGGVVVVAGSAQFAGAAALCCLAAGRSGAGIVTAALHRSLAPVVVGLVPDVTVVFLPDGDGVSAARRAAEAIQERLTKSKAVVVGPGLGDDEGTEALLGALFGVTRSRPGIGFSAGSSPEGDAAQGVVAASGLPVVIDADGLNWLAKQEHWWERLPAGQVVLTPHAGEMARLTGADAEAIAGNPVGAARDAAAMWGQTVVLKGTTTVIAAADGAVTKIAMPLGLATAGSGDVLSGSVGAFLAQGLSGPDAAALAAFAGSRAAARLVARVGTLGLLASDLPLAIAEELAVLERTEAERGR